ncbi:MAG: hypothetical protein J1E02_01325 [Coprobacter sp.]|nr:hypothetical protein [Coprobacter sp.]
MSKLFKSWRSAETDGEPERKNGPVEAAAADRESRGQEYVDALMREQIPATLLERMAELINGSLPEIVRQSIDKEAEKQHIYAHLLEPFTDYVKFIYSKLETDGSTAWRRDEGRYKAEIAALNEKVREANLQKEDIQKSQLSAERQKRALNERVHEFEMRIATLEAEKEQLDMEKSALLNKLKVAAVQDSDARDECVRLQEEKSRADARLSELETENGSLKQRLSECDSLAAQNAGLTASLEQCRRELESLREQGAPSPEEAELKAALESRATQLAGENEKLRSRLAELEPLTAQLAELTAQLEQCRTERDALQEQCRSAAEAAGKNGEMAERLALLESENEEMKEHLLEAVAVVERNEELETELEEGRSQLAALQEQYQALLGDSESGKKLEIAMTQLKEENEELRYRLSESDHIAQEARERVEQLRALREKLSEMENVHLQEVKDLQARLAEAEAAGRNSAVSESELTRLKHDLRVANDMLSAMRTQRQDLLDVAERERKERSAAEQQLSALQTALQQSERDRKALEGELSSLRKGDADAARPVEKKTPEVDDDRNQMLLW